MPKAYLPKIIRAEGKPTEILVYGPIGKSFWSDEGITSKEFVDALNEIPKGQKVVIGVNSQGGAIGEGVAIYNAIRRRSQDITVRIDGYALSAASFLGLGASRVISPPTAIWMIHRGWTIAMGNADDLSKEIDVLNTHDQTMVQAYVAKTGKPEKEIRQAMAEETWLTGAEAIAFGLADEEGENEPDFKAVDLSPARADNFKNFPAEIWDRCDSTGVSVGRVLIAKREGYDAVFASIRWQNFPPKEGGAVNQNKTMNRNEIIALLKTWGVAVADNATDEWLKAELAKGKPEAKPEPKPEKPANVIDVEEFNSLKASIEASNKKSEAEREKRIKAAVANHIEAGRIPKEQEADWTTKALADESILELIARQPDNRREAGGLPQRPLVYGGGKVAREEINKRKAGKERAIFLRDNWDDLLAAGVPLMPDMPVKAGLPVAANTIDSALSTDILRNQVITVLQNRLPLLENISLKFEPDPVKPDAKIQVPIYTAGGTAATNATSFEDTTNFVSTIDNVEIDPARVTVGAHLTAAELQSGRSMSDFAEGKAGEMGDAIMAKVNAVLTTAIFASPAAVTSAKANFSHDKLGEAWAAIAKAMRKSIMLHQDAYRNFLPQNLDQFNVLTAGMPGWDAFMLNTYWTGATTGVYGFACGRQAIALGAGLPAASPRRGNVVTATTIAIPGLGISVELQEWFATAGKVDWMNLEIMVGVKAGDTTAGVLIKEP